MKAMKVLSKLGKSWPILAGAWIASHVIVPLALIRIPVFHKYLISLENALPFNIPGIG